MPFWWRRRRKNWYGRLRYRRRFQRYKGRRRRRRITRRRNRRPARRRRRRRYKVRRKRKTLPIVQWQPDSIRKCKIKGFTDFILGAEGTQMYCFTAHKQDYVPPKVPWGGGFAIEQYNLKLLYEEYTFHNNIWTASNILKDLVRYMGVRLEFYRHPDTDFIVSYSRQPPWDLTKFTFMGCHPHQMLLEKHKRIIFSLASKPHGKYVTKMKIRPPKQMISKWFFSKQFAPKNLFQIKGSALNLRYSFLSATNENRLATIYSINTAYYKEPDWGQARPVGTETYYKPYHGMKTPQYYKVKVKGQTALQQRQIPKENEMSTYSNADAISFEKGWFQPEFLQAKELLSSSGGSPIATHQAFAARYNPNKDSGEGNLIYCVSITSQNWKVPESNELVIAGVPLWLGLHGYVSYIITTRKISFLGLHVICIKSPAIHCYPEIGGCDIYVPIDWDYMSGKLPYDQTPTQLQLRNWYPTINWQLKTLNTIVETGPFVPQYSEVTNSTWELKLGYQFYFKWGGPQTQDPEITNPDNLQTYDVPDTFQQRLQIANPAKLSTESILHPWDWRRGYVKERALKRMCTNLSTDTEFEPSPAKMQKKKERQGGLPLHREKEEEEIQSCLLSLSEKNIFQEEDPQTLQHLIQQQQEQQLELKRSILTLLMDLKQKQRMIQLQTGMLD
nr:MAG: ORF1 [Torque teno midi virus]